MVEAAEVGAVAALSVSRVPSEPIRLLLAAAVRAVVQGRDVAEPVVRPLPKDEALFPRFPELPRRRRPQQVAPRLPEQLRPPEEDEVGAAGTLPFHRCLRTSSNTTLLTTLCSEPAADSR